MRNTASQSSEQDTLFTMSVYTSEYLPAASCWELVLALTVPDKE